MSALFLALGISMAQAVAAAPSAQHHHGIGSMLDFKGTVSSSYEVDLVISEVSPGVRDQDITVRLPDGKQFTMHQRSERSGNSLRITTAHGTGYGTDLGDGVLATYTPGPEGAAYAQTMVLLADETLRLVRTELRNGKAVRFFRESYRSQ